MMLFSSLFFASYACFCAIGQSFTWPDLHIGRPSNESAHNRLLRYQQAPLSCNDIDCESEGLLEEARKRGYSVKIAKGVVGHGQIDYHAIAKEILSLSYSNRLSWAWIAKSPGAVSLGSTVATITKFYCTPIWSINPCRVLSLIENKYSQSTADKNTLVIYRGSALLSKIAYHTVRGHLLQGQESLAVRWLKDEPQQPVILELISISKGSGWLGKLVKPFIGPMQDRFLTDHVRSHYGENEYSIHNLQ